MEHTKSTHIGYLNPADKDHWQAIYASQLYGTFFGVFAKFTSQSTEKTYQIEKIDLKVVNYKGILNLGFDSSKPISLQLASRVKNQPNDFDNPHKLSFHMKAMSTKYTHLLEQDFSLLKGDKILISRHLSKLHASGQALENGVFDDEFYYREGETPGHIYATREPHPNKLVDDEKITFPSILCPNSLYIVA